jgi:hypothetical protein
VRAFEVNTADQQDSNTKFGVRWVWHDDCLVGDAEAPSREMAITATGIFN